MKTLIITLLVASRVLAQDVQNVMLSAYVGDGRTTETAFRPQIADRFSMGWTDLSSVERPDSVGLVLIDATYPQNIDIQVRADTSAFVLSRNPALNNRVQFAAFLARKKSGRALADAIAGKPNVNVDDIIAELRRIDRSKRPRPRR